MTKPSNPYDTKHNVVIGKSTILIPGTEISKADHAAMNKILNKYDKALYRIATYENGQLKSTKGKLSALLIDKTLASQVAKNVKTAGFSMDAMQVGVPFKPGSYAPLASSTAPPSDVAASTPTPTPVSGDPEMKGETAGVGHTPLSSQNIFRSIELVNQLRPILEEYTANN